GLFTFEDTTRIGADLAKRFQNVGAVAHQPAGLDKITYRVGRGKRIARGQRGQLDSPTGKERVRSDEQGVGPLAHERCIGGIILTTGAGLVSLDLQPEETSSRFNFSARGRRRY